MAWGNLLSLGSWIRQMISKDASWPLPYCTFYKNTSLKILLSFPGTIQKAVGFIEVKESLLNPWDVHMKLPENLHWYYSDYKSRKIALGV